MNRKVKNLLAKADREIKRNNRRLRENKKILIELWESILEMEGLALLK